ncbi:MAG TPA: hypothetical protein VE913_21215 [Longimicrobium sp.]|nr:hypothetical protein [Longimicrobium sp.]
MRVRRNGFPIMYSTCLFCHHDLGSNEAIRAFPVGRRLAFHQGRGRLWVVCGACGRWNLTPLEERWEAVEECERGFRDSRTRVSTGNIGLTRLADGTELIRIGQPRRPEMAAWRYGSELRRRERRAMLWSVPVLAGGAGLAAVVGAPLVAAITGPGLVIAALLASQFASVALLQAGDYGALPVRRVAPHLPPGTLPEERGRVMTMLRARVLPREGAPGEWRLAMDFDMSQFAVDGYAEHLCTPECNHRRSVEMTGRPAERLLAVMLARSNRWGGSRAGVRSAVAELERVGRADRFFPEAEARARKMGQGYQSVWELPAPLRFALEMATHEENERRAMEGELAKLEEEWRRAEEIAALADRLAISPAVDSRVAALRKAEGK